MKNVLGFLRALPALPRVVWNERHEILAALRQTPAPKEPVLSSVHELDRYPSSKGCSGIDTCESCRRHLASFAAVCPPNMCIPLPYHFLLAWPDGTYSVLPQVDVGSI